MNGMTLLLSTAALALFPCAVVAQESADPEKYLLLAANRTGRMEEELKCRGARIPCGRGDPGSCGRFALTT